MQDISWGIIGVGDVCEIKSAPAFNKIKGSRLTAVMRRSDAAAKDYAQRHGVPKWYSDADALIEDPDINAIYIATPPHVHAYYVQKAALSGKPIYVEKPMANTHADCLRMINTCKKADVPLFVAYYRRALPNFLAIKNIIQNGTIGDIRFVDIRVHKTLIPDLLHMYNKTDNWRTDPDIAGGGYFNDLASHQLDIMDWLFGPIVKASGYHLNQSKTYKADDIVIGQFQFANGMPGHGSWCFNANENESKEITTVYGSKGSISFPFFGDHSVTLHLEGKPAERITFDIPINIQHSLIQTVVDELQGRGTCPSNAESAARTNQVMEWLLG